MDWFLYDNVLRHESVKMLNLQHRSQVFYKKSLFLETCKRYRKIPLSGSLYNATRLLLRPPGRLFLTDLKMSGKYGPEKTPYLDTCYAVKCTD